MTAAEMIRRVSVPGLGQFSRLRRILVGLAGVLGASIILVWMPFLLEGRAVTVGYATANSPSVSVSYDPLMPASSTSSLKVGIVGQPHHVQPVSFSAAFTDYFEIEASQPSIRLMSRTADGIVVGVSLDESGHGALHLAIRPRHEGTANYRVKVDGGGTSSVDVRQRIVAE